MDVTTDLTAAPGALSKTRLEAVLTIWLPWSPPPRGSRDPSPTPPVLRVTRFPWRPAVLALAVLLGWGVGWSDAASAVPTAGPATGGAAAAERSWHTSLTSARAEAGRDGKLVFVDLFADWCGWCRVLDRKVFSQPVFDHLAGRMVLVRLDVEDGAEGARTQLRYEATGLPTTLILEPSGALVGKVTGVAEPAEYVANIEHQIEVHRRVVRLYERVLASGRPTASEGSESAGSGTEELPSLRVLSLAEAFHKRQDGARAAALYRLLEKRDWTNPRGPALVPFRLADALRLEGRYEAAARTAARARQLALEPAKGGAAGRPAPSERQTAALVEAIDLLGIRIASEHGDCAERREALESFLRRHPESSHHHRVESSLAALEAGADGTGCS